MLGKTLLFVGAILSGLVLQNTEGIFRQEAAKSDAATVAAYASHTSLVSVDVPATPVKPKAAAVGQSPGGTHTSGSQSFKESAAASLNLAQQDPAKLLAPGGGAEEVAKRSAPAASTPAQNPASEAPSGCKDGVCPTSRGSGRWRWRNR